MDFSDEQVVVLRETGDWMRRPFDEEHQVRYVAGYAGVGKTTLAKYIAEESGKSVIFAAYTGKAAYVMRSKGCDPCKTIHSLIYKPAGDAKSDDLRKIEQDIYSLLEEEKSEDNVRKMEQLKKRKDELLIRDRPKPMFTLNMDSDLLDYDILVIDECSMVDAQMGQDILSFRKKVLVLGDPAQLPPVGSGGFFTNRTPDHLLTQIHRQAKESGVLRMATDIRTTGTYNTTPGFYGEDCVVGHKNSFPDLQARVMETDQLLVGLNATRHVSNARYRTLQGRTDLWPEAGDKVVCLRNEHKKGLLNGSLWRVHESIYDDQIQTVDFTISSEEDGAAGITTRAWAHHFIGREDDLKLKQWGRRDCSEFDYGYALTVHKSQGSQWDEVVLFDESGAFYRQHGMSRRWLYTAVTRAARKLVVVYGV